MNLPLPALNSRLTETQLRGEAHTLFLHSFPSEIPNFQSRKKPTHIHTHGDSRSKKALPIGEKSCH